MLRAMLGDDRVVVIDDFLEGSDAHRRAAEIVEFGSIRVMLLLPRLLELLILYEFLFHEQIVLDALELQEAQMALRSRIH